MVRLHHPLTNEDAVRRLRAVLGALDDDLARLNELLATPVAPATLTAEQWGVRGVDDIVLVRHTSAPPAWL